MNDLATVSPMLRDIWEGVARQPGRSGLMVLSVAMAWAILGVMSAVHRGFELYVAELLAELGAHGAVLNMSTDLSVDRAFVRALMEAAPFASWSAIGRAAGIRLADAPDVEVGYADTAWVPMHGWALREGRIFDEADIRMGGRVAVVSEAAATRYGWHAGDRVRTTDGQSIHILGVVGSDHPTPAELADWHPSRAWVLLPAPTVALSPERTVDQVWLRCASSVELRRAMELADRIRGANPAAERAHWITADRAVAAVRVWQRQVLRASAALAVAGLWLGAVALGSLLLHDIRTRVPEIGLRRALGATPRDIARLFSYEAMALAIPASALGLWIAAVIVSRARTWANLPWQLEVQDVGSLLVLVALFSFAVAWGPARMAARLPPAEALRND